MTECELVNRALAVDPDNLKALALSGTAAFERADYAAAVERWQRIIALAPPASEIARSTADSISEAKQLLAQRLQPASAPLRARVEGTVKLDPVLRPQVADTDTVFIYARAAAGSRIPLAVLRKRVADLPLSFVLDDSTSMMPDMKLSDFPSVVVQARISRSDSATPRPGARKMQASKEVWGKIFGTINTREKFEAHRLQLAMNEWRRMTANNSLECRNCHQFESMDFTRQSKRAVAAHSTSLASGEKTCIDCHKGIAHTLPDMSGIR